MKRFHLILLVFAAIVFTAVGCKRTSENKRLPVEVRDASDFITARAIDDTADAFPKRVRKDPPPADENPEQKKQRVDAEAKAEAKAEEKEKQRRAGILENVGKTYKSYFDTGTAKKLTLEDFKLRLTRALLPKVRKELDNQQFELVLEANPFYREHIVAIWNDANQGVKLVALTNQTVAEVKADKVPMRMKEQVVESIYANYVDYAKQNQQKSLDQFLTYLRENAQPAVVKYVANQEVRVNVAAQVGNASHLVACYARADPALGVNTSLLSVMGDGKTTRLEQNVVNGIFQQR